MTPSPPRKPAKTDVLLFSPPWEGFQADKWACAMPAFAPRLCAPLLILALIVLLFGALYDAGAVGASLRADGLTEATVDCAHGDTAGRFYGLDPASAAAHAALFSVFDESQRASRLEPAHPVTRGLRMHSLPYITGDGLRQLADIVVEEFEQEREVAAALAAVAAGGAVASALAPGAAAIVFCAQHVREALLAAGLLEVAAVDIVLVLHNSDLSGPTLDAPWLRHARLRALFTQNCECESTPSPTAAAAAAAAAVRCLPIGLANRHWPHGAALADLTAAVLANAEAAAAPERAAPAAPLVGHACFRDYSNAERGPLRGILADLAWVTAPCSDTPAAYYAGISAADAVVSPRGYGVDAHRSWEALVLGRLVVTRHSSVDALWRAKDAAAAAAAPTAWALPVALLDDWAALSAAQTSAALCAARSVPLPLRATDHAFLPYWACEIGEAAGRREEFCSTEALLHVLARP